MSIHEKCGVNLTVQEILLFNELIESIDARKLFLPLYGQTLLNIQSKMQAALSEQICSSRGMCSNCICEEEIEICHQGIKPWTNFRMYFRGLLEDWEREREEDPDLPSIKNITAPLWGRSTSSPYDDLDIAERISADRIIDAIRGHIAEFQDTGAWTVMDAWVQKKTFCDLQYYGLTEVIDLFDDAIHRDYRPDIED